MGRVERKISSAAIRAGVAIDLGPDRQFAQIGEKGSAFFPVIPPDYRGKKVPVSVIADGFERVDGAPLRLAGESLYVQVRKKGVSFTGVVQSQTGDPVSGAVVQIAGEVTKTDENGSFEVSIPGRLVKEDMTLKVHADGFVDQTVRVVANSNDIGLALERKRP